MDIRAMLHKPAALAVAGIAVVAGIFVAAKMRGGSSGGDTTGESSVTYVSPPETTDIRDDAALADIRKQLADLANRQITPPNDNTYPQQPTPQQPAPLPNRAPRGPFPPKLPTTPQTPVIASITPLSLPAGKAIKITGRDLGNINQITLGGINLPIGARSATTMEVTIPVNHVPGTFQLSGIWLGANHPIHNITVTAVPKTTQPAPQQPTPQKPTDPIPGGYPADCTGVQPRDPANPGAYTPDAINRWVEQYINAGHASHMAWQRALNMAYVGSTGKANLRAVRYTYLALGAAWLNGARRTHGLRPLPLSVYNQLIADIDAEIKLHGVRDGFTKEFVYKLFAKYHAPYICG